MPKRLIYDRLLFVAAGLLVAAGLFMVGSASGYAAMGSGLPPYHYLVRHAIHLLLGCLATAIFLAVPYRKLNDLRVVATALGLSVAALVVVLAMPAAGGAHRWVRLGPLVLQPSEFAKLSAVLCMAYILSHRADQVNEPWAVPLPSMVVIGALAVLVVVEPDLGSAVMLAAPACVMIFVAGLRFRYLAALAGAGVAGIAVSILAAPYRLRRLITYIRPELDPRNAGWQLDQSLTALGSGGLTGVGLGQGQQKAFYLPAAHTDFIYSLIGEELGLLGTALLLAAFLFLFWRGLRTAVRAPDTFGFYLALGITCLLVIQGLVHMGVCVGLLPTKGLPLPFISYGGSSLVASMAAVGILLNVSQHAS